MAFCPSIQGARLEHWNRVFVKIFTQIFDSSIADNWQHRHVFEDLLKLADQNGVVDMTHEAISARTRMPLDLIRDAISALEKADPRSRSKDCQGKRLMPLDSKRGWGWKIVNYRKYRGIKNEFDRKSYMAGYMRKRRDSALNSSLDKSLTRANGGLTVSLTSASASVLKGNGEAGKGEIPAKSILDLKDKIASAVTQRQKLKDSGASESPTGLEWHNQDLRKKYQELGRRIKGWNTQMTGVEA